ncbi:hypothetical protein SLEP1_g49005 [Rubroshorea leprosula]|uniref:Fe2OG dioxygenase domain-containing protein n=1 Tax=Rubroshorea leprosula TaxID=152421 RepID=A0AAV5LWB2_9ROSI|nr:hypothetical protein SLEP1_g49005 [Rubroshorea leprosula]
MARPSVAEMLSEGSPEKGEAMKGLKGVNSKDPFLIQYQSSELKVASEFLTTWLPFLSRDLCQHCTKKLSKRILSLHSEDAEPSNSDANATPSTSSDMVLVLNEICDDNCEVSSTASSKDEPNGWSEPKPEASISGVTGNSPSVETPTPRMSWADMAQEDELVEVEEQQREATKHMVDLNSSTRELRVSKVVEKPKLSRDEREYIRFMNVKRKKDFICLERVGGKFVNILEGLELHTGIFSAAEQKRIVNYVYMLQGMGQKRELRERTYTEPPKWKRGKRRVTIQFGCCYNYATDKNGNPPGILQDEVVDPIPHLFKVMIRRLIGWHVIPPTCVPDSCIVNIYEEGDYIPPHIDNHDFVRPFCTVSFLSECNVVFGSNLKVVGAGEFGGSIAIPLPVGSVLVLNGNGADVAKHCVPAVPTKRISITFRRMDESKRPMGYAPEPDLQGIEPLSYEAEKVKISSPRSDRHTRKQLVRRGGKTEARGVIDSYERQEPEPRYSNRTRRVTANERRTKLSLGS